MSKYTVEHIPYPPYRQSELKPELLGFSALNPFAGYNSSPRSSMFSKHIGQCLVIKGAEPRRIQTGVEREFGKYTFSIGFDNNSYIVNVIDKFPYTAGMGGVDYQSMRTVIFENHDHPDLEVDVMYMPEYHCNHHFFGFNYKYDDNVLRKIYPGSRIPAGTKVANSPNVRANGDYAYGINANTVLGSHPCGIEDGVMMSETFADKLSTYIYETRTFTFGEDTFPLNIYGDENNYKIFPDIGEKVREDGVLCVMRDHAPALAPCDFSKENISKITPFDLKHCCEPGSTVVDITVIHDDKHKNVLFLGMEDQVRKYYERHQHYYREIVNTYDRLCKARGGHLPISRELHRLIVEAKIMLSDLKKHHKKRKAIPPWTVTITTRYSIKAAKGFKITDTHGGKSVTVEIRPDHEMPRDAMGNVADLVVDDKSTIKRLIKGKLHEHYIAACMRDETTRLRRMAEPYGDNIPDSIYLDIWERLLGMYKIISPPFYDKIGEIKPDIKDHVDAVLRDGIYIWMPTDNPVCYLDVARMLRDYYPACNGPVTFTDTVGNKVTTVNNVIIGQIYYILLEKIANDYSAVASAKLQHYGLPAKPSGSARHGEQIKQTPVRFGESEYRLFAATIGGENLSEIADRSLNIHTHEEVLRNLLEAEQPTNIHNLVDREYFPIGDGFMQKVARHSLWAAGVEIVENGED